MTELRWRVLALPPGMAIAHLADCFPGVVTVAGLRNGRAYAAQLTPQGQLSEIPVPAEAAGHGYVRVLRSGDLGILGVCGATGLWGRTRVYQEDEFGPMQVFDVPRDENGAEPAWVWVTAGDGNLQATAAYPTAGGHEIRPLDTDRCQVMPIEQPLITTAPLADVQIAAFAGRITAAGPFTDPLSVWWATSFHPDPEDYRIDPLPWLHHPLEGSPLRITDGIDGMSMSFYAGITAEGTAALWDATGELREVTGVAVDPQDSHVLIAEIEGWGSWGEGEEPGGLAAFAVKAPSGNVLSFQGKTFEMPAGRIRCVVINRGYDHQRCFALIDDIVHIADLDY